MNSSETDYSRGQRLWLWLLAAIGFFGINGTFLYILLARPEVMNEALANPLSLAFVIEAMLMTATLAFLLTKWRVSRLSWWWFIVLSLVGSMAFALPVVLLWPKKRSL